MDIFRYVKLTNQLSFKTVFRKMAQHTGGWWLIKLVLVLTYLL